MKFFISLLFMSFIYTLSAVTNCQYAGDVNVDVKSADDFDVTYDYVANAPSITYSNTKCLRGNQYCVKATCPGVTGAIRGCDGDGIPAFCSSTGCYSLNSTITQRFACTGAANVCCCNTDNCNNAYMHTISVALVIFFVILVNF